jgi:lipid A 3-O-deacylase
LTGSDFRLFLCGVEKMTASSKTIVSLFLFFLLLIPAHAQAQDLKAERPSAGYSALYAKNRLSAQFVAGALFGPLSEFQDYPTFNYAQTNLRFGWMVDEPSKSRYFGTGNFELLFELTNSIVFEGFGNYVRGFTLLGRYNLLLPDPRWALYFQLGVGAVVNDAYKDMSQSAIGQSVEFTPQASIGLRYFISRNWTLDVEAMLHHISNAYLAERNDGIDSVGGFLGVTYFFGELWH